MQLLDVDELHQEINNLARLINAPRQYMPSLNYPIGDATPFIEIASDCYCYIISERGKEYERRSTKDIHELLYWIFEDITWIMSIEYEVKNRIENKDGRRMSFSKQEELLGVLNPEWTNRCARKHHEILNEHPFDDLGGMRAKYCAELRKSGMKEADIWEKALDKYPNTISSSSSGVA